MWPVVHGRGYMHRRGFMYSGIDDPGSAVWSRSIEFELLLPLEFPRLWDFGTQTKIMADRLMKWKPFSEKTITKEVAHNILDTSISVEAVPADVGHDSYSSVSPFQRALVRRQGFDINLSAR